ncbi:MAG: monofunctional biosynthetic peptidoglycan transglycosylase [Selenomonadaceae bacterium]|nr:monofunctional biosynthetic peptidoglycan transglycosylase [Selenomonadaceae bacterium]
MRFFRKLLKWAFILFFVSSVLAVIVYRWVPVKYTPLMFIRYMERKSEGGSPRIEHEWVPLEEMSPNMPLAVWASEDQNFFNHWGFDFTAIGQAIQEAEDGKRQRGASTISQQVAKNVFLWPNSTWVRKGFEVYFTLLIELFWSKQRIMEVYLNSIEMGDGIYGAQAVARLHFRTDAKHLSREQCALIAATLPNPLQRNSARPSPKVYRKQKRILRQMRNLGAYPYDR